MAVQESSEELLPGLLQEHYGLAAEQVHKAPHGMTSEAFEVRTSDGGRLFVKASEEMPCYPIDLADREAALRCTVEIGSLVHRSRVAAPVLTLDGRAGALSGGRLITVFPFITGSRWGRRARWTDEDFASVAATLAELHACTPRLQTKPPQDECAVWWSDPFEEVWAYSCANHGEGEVHRTVLESVERHLDGIRQAVEECFRLRELAMRGAADPVLCHSDVNGGNLLKDPEGGLALVDWDELCLAPMEKDFRHVVDMPRFALGLSTYLEVRPNARPNADALAFFLYRNYLADITYWLCDLVRRPPGWVDPAFNLDEFLGEVAWIAGSGLPERAAALRRLLA